VKKLEKFDPQLITEEHFPQHVDDPEFINYGQCFMWAYLAHKTFKGVQLWDTPYHAFVRYGKKFYDSENPQGVEDWRDLRACRWSYQHQPIKRSNKSFRLNWRGQTRRFKTNWKKLDEQAKEVLVKNGQAT
jgi:hypothetical protein